MNRVALRWMFLISTIDVGDWGAHAVGTRSRDVILPVIDIGYSQDLFRGLLYSYTFNKTLYKT